MLLDDARPLMPTRSMGHERTVGTNAGVKL